MRLVSSGVNAFMPSATLMANFTCLASSSFALKRFMSLVRSTGTRCGHGYLTSSSQLVGTGAERAAGVHLATFIHSPPSMLTRLPTGTSNMPGLSAPSAITQARAPSPRALGAGATPRRAQAHAAHFDGLLELAAVAALPGHLDEHGGGPRRARHPHHLVPPMPA